MNKREVLNLRYCEFLDQLACFAIYNGSATQKKKMRMEDILMVE